MEVEILKYTIWAADAKRAAGFYIDCFGGRIVRESVHITELEIGGGRLAIHGGGSGERTWTGLTFQVAEVVACGGQCARAPEPEDGEPPHLAMCEDSEGNQIMLSRARG